MVSRKSQRRKADAAARTTRAAQRDRPTPEGEKSIIGPPALNGQVARQRLTGFKTYITVPSFSNGEVGPPEGGRGMYDVIVALGVPGRDMYLVDVDFGAAMASGDSQIGFQAGDLTVTISGTGQYISVTLHQNTEGRLAQIRLSVDADCFLAAERFTHDIVMPLISRIAFETNTALDVRTTVVTERRTGIQSISGTVLGSPAVLESIEGAMTPELRPFLASYREGLTVNSVPYQALAFWKVVEGVSTFHVNRARKKGASQTSIPGPDEHRLPPRLEDLLDQDDWTRDCFAPYLGETFGEMKTEMEKPIRDAIAHIVPRLDFHSADVYDDLHACRSVVPVLRYMARVLIEAEIAGLAGSKSPEVSGSKRDDL
jgi:hypothetical protein